MTEAHYTNGSKRRPATLQLSVTVNGHRKWSVLEHVVSGKAEARKLAKELGATPWNF